MTDTEQWLRWLEGISVHHLAQPPALHGPTANNLSGQQWHNKALFKKKNIKKKDIK